VGKVKNFFGGVRQEMRQVTWQTGKELRKYTVTVFGVVILFAIFFFVVDFAITSLLDLFI